MGWGFNRILGWLYATPNSHESMAQMKIGLYVSINGTSQDTFICEIDEEKLEEMMVEHIESDHPELAPLDDDTLMIVPIL